MSRPSDADVIARSLYEGEAFGLIYDRHAPTLLRYLGRRVGAEVAEGLIASNLLSKHRRGEARRLRASARMAIGHAAADGRARAAALEARELFPRVVDALESLPEGERETLLLYAWEDLSYGHIAEALELPVGTVRSRLNRARTRLRELLGAKGKERVRSR